MYLVITSTYCDDKISSMFKYSFIFFFFHMVKQLLIDAYYHHFFISYESDIT